MKTSIARLLITAASLLTGAASAEPPEASQQDRLDRYTIVRLSSLGGTDSSGNSINDERLVAGYSNLSGDSVRHATLWLHGMRFDLGTLGGPNSNVAWPVKNTVGLIAGIAQTATPEPLGQGWSCRAFFPAATRTGVICLGVVWERGEIIELPTLGGFNGFATGANNLRQVVGWTENNIQDPTLRPAAAGPAVSPRDLGTGFAAGAGASAAPAGHGRRGNCDQRSWAGRRHLRRMRYRRRRRHCQERGALGKRHRDQHRQPRRCGLEHTDGHQRARRCRRVLQRKRG